MDMSPSKGTSLVRRSSPNFSTIAASSSLMICRCRSGEARIALYSSIFACSSSCSAMIFWRSRAASRRSCISRIALAWISSISSRPIRPVARDVDGVAAPDQRDDLVDRVQRLEQAAQDVRPLLGLAQPEAGAPDDDLDLVGHPVPDERVERQRARHAVDQRQHVGAEVGLQVGVLVEVVQHDLGDRVALEHDHQPLAGARRGLVADVGDAADLAVLHQVGDLLREVVRVDLVRQLGDHQALAVLDLLDLDDRAHGDRAAAGAVRLLDAACGRRPGRRSGSPGP